MKVAGRRARACPAARTGQRGAVLLALILFVLLFAGAAFLQRVNSTPRGPEGYDEAATRKALADAKAALLGYSVWRGAAVGGGTSTARPGELPCPDQDYDSDWQPAGPDQNGNDCAAYIGWLPTSTLGVGELRDGASARLWYAVSRTFQAAPNGDGRALRLNSNTQMMRDAAGVDPAIDHSLVVDGEADIAAIVIAAGPAIGDEDRSPPGVSRDAVAEIAQYLDDANSDLLAEPDTALRSFATGAGVDANDRIITITRTELLAHVERYVLSEAKAGLLRRFYNAGTVGEVGPNEHECTVRNQAQNASLIAANWCLPWLQADPFVAATVLRGGEQYRFSGWLPLAVPLSPTTDPSAVAFFHGFATEVSFQAAGTWTEAGAGPVAPQPPYGFNTDGSLDSENVDAVCGAVLDSSVFCFVEHVSSAIPNGDCAATGDEHLVRTRSQLLLSAEDKPLDDANVVNVRRPAEELHVRRRGFTLLSATPAVVTPAADGAMWPLLVQAAASARVQAPLVVGGPTEQFLGKPAGTPLPSALRIVRECVTSDADAEQQVASRYRSRHRHIDSGPGTELMNASAKDMPRPLSTAHLGLPEWFGAQGWNEQLYLSYTPGTGPAGSDSGCDPLTAGPDDETKAQVKFDCADPTMDYRPEQFDVALDGPERHAGHILNRVQVALLAVGPAPASADPSGRPLPSDPDDLFGKDDEDNALATAEEYQYVHDGERGDSSGTVPSDVTLAIATSLADSVSGLAHAVVVARSADNGGSSPLPAPAPANPTASTVMVP